MVAATVTGFIIKTFRNRAKWKRKSNLKIAFALQLPSYVYI